MNFPFFLALSEIKSSGSDISLLHDIGFMSLQNALSPLFEGCGIKYKALQAAPDLFNVYITEDEEKYFMLMFFRVQCGVEPVTSVSAAPSGKWDIWCVRSMGTTYMNDITRMHEEQDYTLNTIPFRILRRLRRSGFNRANSYRYLLGPWTAKTFLKKVDFLFDILYFEQNKEIIRIPWVFAGESPEQMAELDYNPSDEEVDDDIEIEEEILNNSRYY